MATPLTRAGVFLMVTALAATPAFAQNARERQMMADIRMLQEQTQQIQQSMQAALQELAASLKAINARIDDQTNASRKAFADQKLAVDQFATDLRNVRERVDETNVRISSLSQEVEALRLAIPPAPVAAPPVDPAVDPATLPPGATAPPAAPPVAQPPSTAGLQPQRLFDTAMADYYAGQWDLCIDGFNTYIRAFPRSEMADDAQYYIGECHFSDGKFTEAVDAYNRVIVTYPRGDQVPLAYYKRGIAFDRLGQADRARESWETLMKQYPDTEAARLGKQNLDRLNRGKPPEQAGGQ